MRIDEINESGMIDREGRLLLPMERINMFSRANAGKRIMVRFIAVEPGSTEAQRAYYYAYILPTIKAALWEVGQPMADIQVDEWIRVQCPFCYGDDGILTAEQMNKKQMSDFIGWLQWYCAENLHIFVEDAKNV